MINIDDLAPLYDFSLVEKAVQDFFCQDAYPFVKPPDEDDPNREAWSPGADGIAFYTPTQATVLQSVRPRVGILETNFSEFQGAKILDADGVYRASGWRGTLRTAIITDCSYALHRALRGQVIAILPLLQPLLTGDLANVGKTGINVFLKYHEVGQFAMQSGDTNITPQQGYYMSTLAVNLTFSVRATAWPGGTLTP